MYNKNYLKLLLTALYCFFLTSTYANEGWLQIKNGNFIQAEKEFLKKLASDSTDKNALYGMIFLSETKEDPASYMKYVNTLIRNHWNDQDFQLFNQTISIEFKDVLSKNSLSEKSKLDYKIAEGNDAQLKSKKLDKALKIYRESLPKYNWSYIGPFKNVGGSGHLTQYPVEKEKYNEQAVYSDRIGLDLKWVKPSYTAGTGIASTGVTGLTATLTAGTLASGAGNLSYTVSGTAGTAGTASFALSFGGQSCSINLTVNTAGCTTPTVFTSNYKNGVIITSTCSTVTLRSVGTPEHVSPYWGVGHALYEAPSLPGQIVNPGNLQAQVFVMTIPTTPVEAAVKEATSLGPIGMALNGVAIYNDREAGNVPVDAGTLLSFDRAGAHSGPGGLYHYHFTGDFTGNDNANLIGFLRDGFPIYARKDMNGSYPSNLDVNGGHVGVTADYPGGIYHYHATNTAYMGGRFYVLKAGSYHGTKGIFTF